MTAPPMAADHAHARRITERTRSARLIRDSIGLLSSKWSVDVLLALGDGTRPGLLVAPGDPAALAAALRAWLEDAELRDRLRLAARERRAKLRPWAATASAIADVLAGVVASAAGVAGLAGASR